MRFPPTSTQLLAWAAFAFLVFSAEADTASRLYEQGKYKEAYERYKTLAEKEKENWPLFYNMGAAAYKTGRADEAVRAFERSLGSSDQELQAKAFYNLGNSYYRIGQAAEGKGPEQAIPVYEQSLKSYQQTLALNPNDEDAKFNQKLVEDKLKELKQKQQQKDQEKQNKEGGDKDEKNQEKQENQQNQQNQQKEQQQQQQNQSQQQQQKPKEPEPQEPGEKSPEEKQQQEQQQTQQAREDNQPQPPGSPTNQLERLQAQILLDNLREEERNWNFFPELQMNLKDSAEAEKDW